MLCVRQALPPRIVLHSLLFIMPHNYNSHFNEVRPLSVA
jgi:hypothetical protein